jgi:predicted esterase
VPVLILAGFNDPLVPADQAALLAALLGEAGADVTYEAVQGGHGLTADDLSLAAAGCEKWLMPPHCRIDRCPFSNPNSSRPLPISWACA